MSVPSPPTLHDLDVFSEQFECIIATANAMDVGFQSSQCELFNGGISAQVQKAQIRVSNSRGTEERSGRESGRDSGS